MTLRAASRALLLGNFAIGTGVMVAPGSLNDLVPSLQVSVATAGQLVSVAAVAMAVGAPVLAAALGGFERRRLLTLALVWYAAGHLLCACMPSFAALLPVRALAVLAAAVFTPQAAAAVNVMAPAEQRGRIMTFIFLGWSLSSVLGMPLNAWVAETLGWRWAFAAVALLSLLAAAAVWRTMPDGVRPPPLSLRNWGQVFSSPVLMGLLAITVISGSGQFTLFTYLAPYYRQVLGAAPEAVSFLFLWYGAFGLVGNILLTRWIDRLGAARCVSLALLSMAVALLLWPLGTTVASVAVVALPWALGVFSSNSAQQARLSMAAPALAPALLALNTSAIYLGQAVGAASGGAMLSTRGYGALSHTAFSYLCVALALSVLLGWHMGRQKVAHG